MKTEGMALLGDCTVVFEVSNCKAENKFREVLEKSDNPSLYQTGEGIVLQSEYSDDGILTEANLFIPYKEISHITEERLSEKETY